MSLIFSVAMSTTMTTTETISTAGMSPAGKNQTFLSTLAILLPPYRLPLLPSCTTAARKRQVSN